MASTWVTLVSLSWIHGLEFGLPVTAGLAAIALIGYMFGKRTRHTDQAASNVQRLQELERASGIAHRLESIASELRQDLASHHSRLARFRHRLNDAQESRDEPAWKQLCAEAESMLSPTMQLAEQLSLAYDAIRQQSDALETFAQSRTDRLTGAGNVRALETKLGVLFAAAPRNGASFSIALMSMDRDAPDGGEGGERTGKAQLPEFARLIQSCMRDNDYVARYGEDEFVVVMPQTSLSGACVFGEWLLEWVTERLGRTSSCGLAECQEGDNAKSLLGRADSAFYSAKAAGGNRLFVYSGGQIREHRRAAPVRSEEATVLGLAMAPIPPLDGAADCYLSAEPMATL